MQKIPNEVSIYLRLLHQENGLKLADIARKYPQYATRSVYRHGKLPVGEKAIDKRKFNSGRPKKLTERDIRNIERAIIKLRKQVGSFPVRAVKSEASIGDEVSYQTVRRAIKQLGYGYRKARKKGLLTKTDLKERIKFANKVTRLLRDDFWTKGISFYLDGVGFTHKYNPLNDARTTKTMSWRKSSEGLIRECTTRGKKEGSAGRIAKFVVAIAHNKGVICCEQYMEKMSGEVFANFIRNHFPATFQSSANPTGKLFLQDGDPSQNSAKAKRAMDEVGCKLFSIPPRSPDVNPIENLFHLVRKQLSNDALSKNITKENFKQFSARVKTTLENFSVETINNMIESMNKRIKLIKKGKGLRTKY